jgi:hypothetical protein
MEKTILCEIVQQLGTLSQSAKGWQKQINLISWNEKEPKFDIRDWSPNGEKMGKGITFTVDELRELKSILNGLDI